MIYTKQGKRLLATLVSLALLLCSLPFGISLAESAPTSSSAAYINADGVNFRSGPSTKYATLGQLSKGTAVTVTGSSGSWYKLTVDSTGKSGYVFKRYVTSGTAAEASTSTAAYINADGVNFRTGPSTKHAAQGQLSKGTAVTVTGSSGSWYKLTVDSTGKSGYVFKRYVTSGTAAEASTSTAAYINADGVNFRTGPSTKHAAQGQLSKGTAVTVTGSSGSWYKLTVDSTGKSGYVFKRYVTPGTAGASTASPTAPSAPTTEQAGYVNGASVHFRSGPSTKYKSLGLLRRNSAVTVLGVSGNWYKIRVDATGQAGYISARYVTLGQSPSASAAPATASPSAPSGTPAPTSAPTETAPPAPPAP